MKRISTSIILILLDLFLLAEYPISTGLNQYISMHYVIYPAVILKICIAIAIAILAVILMRASDLSNVLLVIVGIVNIAGCIYMACSSGTLSTALLSVAILVAVRCCMRRSW